jgi:hypothetical protein
VPEQRQLAADGPFYICLELSRPAKRRRRELLLAIARRAIRSQLPIFVHLKTQRMSVQGLAGDTNVLGLVDDAGRGRRARIVAKLLELLDVNPGVGRADSDRTDTDRRYRSTRYTAKRRVILR